MCGICGIHDPNGFSSDALARMTNALAHRGPDDGDQFVSQTVGLGHRRLSIIDIDGGRQPMSNEDGSIWITFNGEIYNHAELRRSLEHRFEFRTRSDTEVILRLYEELEDKCVDRLRGMFAFAIHDSRRGRLFLARDHMGQKPLYYVHTGKRFAFASEIKSLLALDPQLRQLDGDALCEYLSLRIITPPRSMFRQIRKLPPAHSLSYENGRVSLRRYWEPNYTTKTTLDLEEAVEELDERLEEAVSYHMVSDVEVGAFLSGGLDSSLVVAKMRQVSDAPLQTFSGDLSYGDRSELPYARMVSQRYATKAHELSITPKLVELLPRVIHHLDEPSDPLSACVYALAQFTRPHVKVVLGGDGGDELFAGYDRYFGYRYAGALRLLPRIVRERVLGALSNRLERESWYRSHSHQLRWLLHMSSSSGATRYAQSLRYFFFGDDLAQRVFTTDYRKQIAAFDPEENIRRHFEAQSEAELVDRMLYTDQATRLPDHPVMILDRMSMAHGLEARSPFLDHELAEFCASLPSRYKIRGRQRRVIQKELARRYLPEEILARSKQGFSSAFPYMLATSFQRLYASFLQDAHLVRDGYLCADAIADLLSEHVEGRVDHGNRLWLLCNSELWYRMAIEQESVEALEHQLQQVLAS